MNLTSIVKTNNIFQKTKGVLKPNDLRDVSWVDSFTLVLIFQILVGIIIIWFVKLLIVTPIKCSVFGKALERQILIFHVLGSFVNMLILIIVLRLNPGMFR